MSADPVRWFDEFGNCTVCGKPATGTLRGIRNESFGRYCTKCAVTRLQRADKERTAEQCNRQMERAT